MDILDIFGHFYLNHLSPLWGYFYNHQHGQGILAGRVTSRLMKIYLYGIGHWTCLLNIGSIRMNILMTGRNVEQTKDVRMYIEEYLF